MEKKRSIAFQVGEYLILAGIIVVLSYLVSLKFYAAVFDDYNIGIYIQNVKIFCGLLLVISGIYIIKLKNWARLLSIYICILLGIFSIYCSVKINRVPSFVSMIFYFLPVILLMLPKVKEQFK